MTPEQEDELVARWVGWEPWDLVREDFWIRLPFAGDKDLNRGVPPYRTDPALLWELQVGLCEMHGWQFKCVHGGRWRGVSPDDEGIYETLAEAVFAAAVMQAQQEGK